MEEGESDSKSLSLLGEISLGEISQEGDDRPGDIPKKGEGYKRELHSTLTHSWGNPPFDHIRSLIPVSPMPLGNEPPQLLKQRLFYAGRKFDFEVNRLRLPNKSVGEWECIRHPGGALAIPVTPEGQLVLVRQYRFAVRGRLLEFPAGTIEDHEDPLTTIQREIQEETGYRAATWQSLGNFALAPGYSDELIYAYLATDLEKIETPLDLDADEDLEVVLMTPEQLEKAIWEREAVDAKSIASFFMARPYLVG